MGRVGISVMSSLTSLEDMFITFIDGAVHRVSHYAPYVGYNIYIYTYNTIYDCPAWVMMVGSMCTMVV